MTKTYSIVSFALLSFGIGGCVTNKPAEPATMPIAQAPAVVEPAKPVETPKPAEIAKPSEPIAAAPVEAVKAAESVTPAPPTEAPKIVEAKPADPAPAVAVEPTPDKPAEAVKEAQASVEVVAVIATAEVKPSEKSTTQPANAKLAGTVTFTSDQAGKVKVVAVVSGLAPNTKHGFHIHEKGDLSAPDLMSAGGHFNPGKHIHGGPTTSPVHEGDLGNLEANADGIAKLELTLDGLSIGTGEKNDIVGRSVIIHAKPDDFSSQPSGNSGSRIAGGLIEKK